MFDSLLFFFNKVFFFTGFVSGESFPQPLTRDEEERNLRLAKEGDELAKEILIRHNLRLVAHIVKKYTNQGEVDDLISIGSIGLIKAINTFEYGKGSVLATYIARCVENEILMFIRSSKKLKNNVSLYEGIGYDKDGKELQIMDLLYFGEDVVFKEVENDIFAKKLIETLKTHLEAREFEIICMRYGLLGKHIHTQRETAKVLNISRSYISRIEKKALLKLKGVLNKSEF